MARRSHLNPARFELAGGSTGVLLIHGFTGAPTEMRLLGEYLNQQGMTVLAPLLPGHGVTVEEMAHSTWQQWTNCTEEALAELRTRCDTVFVGGLSMGALLTLYLAIQHQDLAGALLYSPALEIANRFIRFAPLFQHVVGTISKGPNADQDLTSPTAIQHLWSYEVMPVVSIVQLLRLRGYVRKHLAEVHCPLLIVHSTGDPTIRSDSAQRVFDGVGTPESQKHLLTLHNSGHNLLVDSEWQAIAQQSWEFIRSAY